MAWSRSNQDACRACQKRIEEPKCLLTGRRGIKDARIGHHSNKAVENRFRKRKRLSSGGALHKPFGVATVLARFFPMRVNQDVDIRHPHGWLARLLAEARFIFQRYQSGSTIKIHLRIYQFAANRVQTKCRNRRRGVSRQQAAEGVLEQRTQGYATLGGALFSIFEERRGEGDRRSHIENDSIRMQLHQGLMHLHKPLPSDIQLMIITS
jgi:hypothetical protein